MKSAVALLLDRCGLTAATAAQLLGCSTDAVKSWASYRNNPPPSVTHRLRVLYGLLDRAARAAAREIEASPPELTIELALAADDAEAQALGWPSRRVHEAALGLTLAFTPRAVAVAPRGSSPAAVRVLDVAAPIAPRFSGAAVVLDAAPLA